MTGKEMHNKAKEILNLLDGMYGDEGMMTLTYAILRLIMYLNPSDPYQTIAEFKESLDICAENIINKKYKKGGEE